MRHENINESMWKYVKVVSLKPKTCNTRKSNRSKMVRRNLLIKLKQNNINRFVINVSLLNFNKKAIVLLKGNFILVFLLSISSGHSK